jgi:hypothetical protein
MERAGEIPLFSLAIIVNLWYILVCDLLKTYETNFVTKFVTAGHKVNTDGAF